MWHSSHESFLHGGTNGHGKDWCTTHVRTAAASSSSHHRVRRGLAKLVVATTAFAWSLPAAPATAVVITCVSASGAVRDAHGAPIVAARVSETSAACTGHTTSTDAAGRYEIEIPVQTGSSRAAPSPGTPTARARASKSGYDAVQQIVYATVEPSSEPLNDMTLPFELSAAVSPSAVQSGATVTFSAITTAPPEGTDATRVIGERADGTRFEFGRGATDAAGRTTWRTTFVADTANASVTLQACAVDIEYGGNCTTAAAIGPPTLVSNVKTARYVVDDLPPHVVSTLPERYQDTAANSTVSVGWTDGLAGMAMSTATLLIDGSSPVTTVVANEVRATGLSLTPGVHVVEVAASDNAGNRAQDRFVFTVAEFQAPGVMATIDSTTQAVNPSNAFPPPTKIVFNSPTAHVEPYVERLSGSTSPGLKRIARTFAFDYVTVEFRNDTGVPWYVSAPVPTVSVEQSAAVLSPSASTLEALLPPTTATLAAIEVDVPVGYGDGNSTATLVPTTATGLRAQKAGPDQSLGRIRVLGALFGCFEDSVRECENTPAPYFKADLGGREVSVFVPLSTPPDPDDDARLPICETTAGTTGACGSAPIAKRASRVVFGCTDYATVEAQLIDLCNPQRTLDFSEAQNSDGAASVQLNAGLYEAIDGSRTQHPLWQQNHVDIAPAGDRCAKGKDGKVEAALHRAVTNTESLDHAGVALTGGTFRPYIAERTASAPQRVELGEWTAATPGSGVEGVAREFSNRPYQLANSHNVRPLPSDEGVYTVTDSGAVDALGAASQARPGSANTWEWSSSPLASINHLEGAEGSIQLTTGTEFTTDEGYGRLASFATQLVVDFTGCAGGTS